jgi:esterase/lipase superfamily enzyme
MKRAMHQLSRLVTFWAATLLACGSAYAQGLPDGSDGRCRTVEPLSSLEQRKKSLEEQVARSADGKMSREEIRKNREQLLDILFQIDCINTTPAPPPLRRSARPAPKSEVIEVLTYYATNRKKTANTSPSGFYGSDVSTGLEYGRAYVTIPPGHVPGNLELPALWKLERDADPSKHFVLKAVEPLKSDAARKELADRLGGARALLLFVHGYNTGFAEAALRTAQMAHDLKFPGVPLFYSWPSAGKALAYWQDEEASQLSEAAFDQVLEDLSNIPNADIYLVAHSMGNRIVAGALRSRIDRGKTTRHLRELLLAAPDINAEIFRTTIAPRLASMRGTRTTIYASSSDLALRASKLVHGFRRVGETVGGVITFEGVDTIDASGAAAATRAYGHSYLMDSASVIGDIQAIVLDKALATARRGLSGAGSSPNAYWILK